MPLRRGSSEQLTPEQRIANRNNWLRIGLVSAAAVVLGWKLIRVEIPLNLTGLDYSDILALLLALFAIYLSAAFYFKATETSNRFYHDIHIFTQETSKTLGRVESGFGEQLTHIREAHSHLRSQMERLLLQFSDTLGSGRVVLEEATETLQDFPRGTTLPEGEADEWIGRIREHLNALSTAQEELDALKEELVERGETVVEPQIRPPLSKSFLQRFDRDYLPQLPIQHSMSDLSIKRNTRKWLLAAPESTRADFIRNGFATSSCHLTSRALVWIRRLQPVFDETHHEEP